MLRILIADNYPIYRMGICKVLEERIPGIEISEASSTREAVKQLKMKHFDLLLLALSQPGKNNIDLLRSIKQKYPGTAVLVICIYSESAYGYRALSVGASGYVTRETSAKDLVLAVKKILGGDSYISGAVAQNMLAKINKGASISSIELLSTRELQILQLMTTGKKTSSIASETNLSISTIATYRQRIFTKLNMKTGAELIRFAIDNSLA